MVNFIQIQWNKGEKDFERTYGHIKKNKVYGLKCIKRKDNKKQIKIDLSLVEIK